MSRMQRNTVQRQIVQDALKKLNTQLLFTYINLVKSLVFSGHYQKTDSRKWHESHFATFKEEALKARSIMPRAPL